MSKNTEDFFKKKKEWSKIKDDILACYLKPYFTKIRSTKKPIVYIDGFAGAGKFEDGTLGSPLIVYNLVNDMEFPLDIRYYFIEKKYYEELSENTAQIKNCKVIGDTYEKNIVGLISSNCDKNVFVYIDPFGIKNINFSYLQKLNMSSLNSAEFLMNLNSFGFIREGCRLMKTELTGVEFDEFDSVMDESNEFKAGNSVGHMNEIAGGDYWQDIIRKHKNREISGYEAEKMFVDGYCNALEKTGKFKYVISIPIRMKAGIPPKYRMVFATNHLHGVLLMNDNMCNRFEEMKDIQTGGMCTLFQENSENEVYTDDIIEGQLISLLNLDFVDYYTLIVKYIKKYGIMKTSVLNRCLKEMEKKGTIEIKRVPPVTPTGMKSKFITPPRISGSTEIKLVGVE